MSDAPMQDDFERPLADDEAWEFYHAPSGKRWWTNEGMTAERAAAAIEDGVTTVTRVRIVRAEGAIPSAVLIEAGKKAMAEGAIRLTHQHTLLRSEVASSAAAPAPDAMALLRAFWKGAGISAHICGGRGTLTVEAAEEVGRFHAKLMAKGARAPAPSLTGGPDEVPKLIAWAESMLQCGMCLRCEAPCNKHKPIPAPPAAPAPEVTMCACGRGPRETVKHVDDAGVASWRFATCCTACFEDASAMEVTTLDIAEGIISALDRWMNTAHHHDKCRRRNGESCDCGKHDLINRVNAYRSLTGRWGSDV